MTVPNTENLSIGREKQTNSDVEFMIEPKPALMVGKGRIPQDMLDDLNSMCDDLQSNPETESYAPNLVGEIQNGSQLAVDIEDKRFKRYRKLLKDSCNLYINHFWSALGKTSFPYHLEIDDVWTVHQYEGDYNPLHDHGSQAYSAFASFIHLKLPDQLKKNYENFTGSSIYNAQGTLDGITSFVWGDVGNRETTIFRFPGTEYIIPEEGVYYIFPLWLNHCVYPFRGPGERRSLSCNVEVWYDSDFLDNPSPDKVVIT
tara:strand:- start:43992 stop:44765 length:774 start_codon:yes stop_codon:yes gene_type:complete